MRSRNHEMVLDEVPNHMADELKNDRALLSTTVRNMSVGSQKKHVKKIFIKWYKNQSAKELQVNTTISLINGFNTFLLAGTGYGKSRISEIFMRLFSPSQLPVVLVLNPLDALGDNQVSGRRYFNDISYSDHAFGVGCGQKEEWNYSDQFN